MKKLLLLAPLIFLTISSCDLLPKSTVDTGVSTLNEAIRKLEANSNSWQKVLEETRDTLIKEGQSTLANEVSNVLSRATGNIGIEAKCYTDFLRDRTREELIKLRATITNEQLELKPVFCNPTPSSIDMNLPPNRRSIIEITGYNLTRDSIQVFLVGQRYRLDISKFIDNPTDYLLTVRLDRVPLMGSSERLIFRFPNGEEKSIGIIKAYIPPQDEFRLSRIHITGFIYMNDDENIVKDENKNIKVDTYVDIRSDSNTLYHWEDCVGDEVQGYLDVQMQLNKETGVVTGQGTARYYEGTRCGETNLKRSVSFTFPEQGISQGQVYPLQQPLSDNDGGVRYDLNFTNEYVEKVLVPQPSGRRLGKRRVQ